MRFASMDKVLRIVPCLDLAKEDKENPKAVSRNLGKKLKAWHQEELGVVKLLLLGE